MYASIRLLKFSQFSALISKIDENEKKVSARPKTEQTPFAIDSESKYASPDWYREGDAGFFTSLHYFIGPDGAVNFADVSLPEEEHADSGLADSAADGQRKSVLKDRLLEGELGALRAAGFVELLRRASASTRIPMEESSSAMSKIG